MTQSPPGWHPDPGGSGGLRWWDGTAWTAHTQPTYAAPRAAPSGPTTPDGEPLAGWWWRVLATVIDSVVLGVAGAVVSAPAQLAVQRELRPIQEDFNRRVAEGRPVDFGDFFGSMADVYAAHVVGLMVVPMLLGIVYHAALLRWKGATVGKLACGLRVRPVTEPRTLSWTSIAARLGTQTVLPAAAYAVVFTSGSVAVVALGSLAVLAYYVTDALFAARSSRRAIHDLAAGTVVVSTRR